MKTISVVTLDSGGEQRAQEAERSEPEAEQADAMARYFRGPR